MKNTPILKEGDIYTAKEITKNKWTPCIECHKEPLCQSQCVWIYWSMGDRENTKYKYDPNNKFAEGGRYKWTIL